MKQSVLPPKSGKRKLVVGRRGCSGKRAAKSSRKQQRKTSLAGKGFEAYDSLEEALAVNGEIKEAKGRSVDDTRADWKRKAHPLNILQKTRRHGGRVAEQLAADGTTAVNKGGSRSTDGAADGSDRSK